MPLTTIAEAISRFRSGQMVIIVDDEDRENEGDLCLPAEDVSPEAIAFMASHGRGLVCVPILGEQLECAGIPLIAPHRASQPADVDRPNFALPVDASHGVGSGISAADRTQTIRRLIDPSCGPEDFVTPGHVFPLRYTEGGVLRRRGQTEASVDLAILAGKAPAAVICEVMNESGTMACLPDLEILAAQHGMPIISVEQLARFRQAGAWPLGESRPLRIPA